MIQQLMKKILPKKWAEDMEADSRRWMIQCSSCNFEQSIWDIGGVKWKAYGTSYTAKRCKNCGKIARHKVYKKQEAIT
jgi:hypothetical protein